MLFCMRCDLFTCALYVVMDVYEEGRVEEMVTVWRLIVEGGIITAAKDGIKTNHAKPASVHEHAARWNEHLSMCLKVWEQAVYK